MMSKLVYGVNQMSTWAYMNIKSQGHSDSTFSDFFSLETAGPIEAKFHM